MKKIDFSHQLQISQDFKFHPACLNCYRHCGYLSNPIYGYFYNPNSMDDTGGHSFICRACWIKNPQYQRERGNWEIFTPEIADQVTKDWNESDNE